MKSKCPCCEQDVEFSLSTEDSIGNLIQCSHCQSVLKWKDQVLQIVRKGVTESSVESNTKAEQNASSGNADTIEEPVISNESQKEVQPLDTPVESAIEEKIVDALQEDNSAYKEESSIEDKEFSKPTSAIPASQNLSDVEAYGNKESSAYTGLLRYDLQIMGVDSVEIEKQIESILEDPRLKIDTKACLEEKKNNIIYLKNLNPVKAVYLVSQLIHLSLELSWKQYMAVKTDETEEEHEEGDMDIS